MSNLTNTESVWSGSQTQTKKSSTYTFETFDKYVDKDIELTVNVEEGSASVDEGQQITHNPTISLTGDKKSISASVSYSGQISGSVTKAGWITSVNPASIAVTGESTTTISSLDSNFIADNLVKGVVIFGTTGTGKNEQAVTFGNTPSVNAGVEQTYTDISSSAPVLIDGGYLYINEGRVENSKISLAKLVPDGTTVGTSTQSNLIYKTATARNDDGKLITGTMNDASVKSGAPAYISNSLNVGESDNGYYSASITTNVSAPTVSTAGYITSTIGTKVANNNVDVEFSLPACDYYTDGIRKQSGIGTSSIAVNGYYNGSSVSSTDKITLESSPKSGYYKIGTTGSGSVTVSPLKLFTTVEGWMPNAGGNGVILNQETTLQSDNGTSDYYVKKSTVDKTSITPSNTTQTVTISDGYYPTTRTITIDAVDISDPSQATPGSLSVQTQDGYFSLYVTDEIIDEDEWKYRINIGVDVQPTAVATVDTNGYVDATNNVSKTWTINNSTSMALDLYDGSFVVS